MKPFSTAVQLNKAFYTLFHTVRKNKEFAKVLLDHQYTMLEHPEVIDNALTKAIDGRDEFRGTCLLPWWESAPMHSPDKSIFRRLFMAYFDHRLDPVKAQKYKVYSSMHGAGTRFYKKCYFDPALLSYLISDETEDEIMDCLWNMSPNTKKAISQDTAPKQPNTGEVSDQIFVGDVNISTSTIEQLTELVRELRDQVANNADMIESSAYYTKRQKILENAIAVCCNEIDQDGKE